MKRSESFLVYGVTSILVVILAVAVIFGDEDGRSPAPTDTALVSDQQLEEASLIDLAGEDVIDEDLTEAEDAAEQSAEESAEAGLEAVLADGAALRAVSAQTLFGSYERESHYGLDFRVVEVRRGDSFPALVERWCGTQAAAAEVRALNETLDVDALHPGTKVRMPWVPDEELIAAYELRQQRRAAPVVTSPAGTSVREASATTTAGTTGGTTAARAAGSHTVQSGESLWKIAEAKVGKRGASAYVDAICELNGISDAGRIRVGQKLLLPPVQ